MSLLRDETGSYSTARCALWVTLLAVLYLIVTGAERVEKVWDILEAVMLALIGWAGGSRISQHIASMRAGRIQGGFWGTEIRDPERDDEPLP